MTARKIAILWRGDRETRANATPANNRYHRIFEELAARGIDAEAAVYADDMADEVYDQIIRVDGVLVWVNPLDDGRTRAKLDAVLRDVAAKGPGKGPWVSAHPDVILKMGVKEVLHRTKHLGWGAGTRLYRSTEEFRDAFPASLCSSRTAAMPGRACGRSRTSRSRPVRHAWFRYWKRGVAASPKSCRSQIS